MNIPSVLVSDKTLGILTIKFKSVSNIRSGNIVSIDLKQIKYTLNHRKAFKKIKKELLGEILYLVIYTTLIKYFYIYFFDYQKVHVDYEIKQVFDNYRYVEYNDI